MRVNVLVCTSAEPEKQWYTAKVTPIDIDAYLRWPMTGPMTIDDYKLDVMPINSKPPMKARLRKYIHMIILFFLRDQQMIMFSNNLRQWCCGDKSKEYRGTGYSNSQWLYRKNIYSRPKSQRQTVYETFWSYWIYIGLWTLIFFRNKTSTSEVSLNDIIRSYLERK